MNDADERKLLRNLKRRLKRKRHFPFNTCPASRHLHMLANDLAEGRVPWMMENEPLHCAHTMLSVLESLWELRTKSGEEQKVRERMSVELRPTL